MKDDKNLNITTGRDFIYTITHGIGGIWFAIIISIIILGSSYWIYSITKSNEQSSNLQEQKNKQLLNEKDENSALQKRLADLEKREEERNN